MKKTLSIAALFFYLNFSCHASQLDQLSVAKYSELSSAFTTWNQNRDEVALKATINGYTLDELNIALRKYSISSGASTGYLRATVQRLFNKNLKEQVKNVNKTNRDQITTRSNEILNHIILKTAETKTLVNSSYRALSGQSSSNASRILAEQQQSFENVYNQIDNLHANFSSKATDMVGDINQNFLALKALINEKFQNSTNSINQNILNFKAVNTQEHQNQSTDIKSEIGTKTNAIKDTIIARILAADQSNIQKISAQTTELENDFGQKLTIQAQITKEAITQLEQRGRDLEKQINQILTALGATGSGGETEDEVNASLNVRLNNIDEQLKKINNDLTALSENVNEKLEALDTKIEETKQKNNW